MDAPTISIKIKGLQAVDALNNGKLLGGLKINGAMMGMRGMGDGNRLMMAKKGLMMREMEMEGNRMMLLQPSNATSATKSAVASAPAAKGAVSKAAGGAVLSSK